MATDTDAWAQAGLIYQLSDGVAWLRLNRPQQRNAIDHYPGGKGRDHHGRRFGVLGGSRSQGGGVGDSA
jgi:hypothetical protein